MTKRLCIYSSFLIQRRGLRLREEAIALCFTEIELCFRDIYEKEKKKGKCYCMYGSYLQ